MNQSDQIFYPNEFEQPTVVEQLKAEIASLKSQLSQARAETIEACAKVADMCSAELRGLDLGDDAAVSGRITARGATALEIAQRIRALSPANG